MLARAFLHVVALRGVALILAAGFLAGVTLVVPTSVFGQFSLAMSVSQVIAAVFFSWLNPALLRYGREEYLASGAIGRTLAARLWIHVPLLLVAAGLSVAIAPQVAAYAHIETKIYLSLLVIYLLLAPLSELASTVGQIAERFFAYGWTPVLMRLGQAGAVAAIIAGASADWKTLMAGTLIGSALASLVGWGSLPATLLHGGAKEGRVFLKRIVAFGWTLPLATLSAFLVNWMDIWFIKYFLDIEAAGIYAWAYNITLIAMTFLVPLSAVLAPRALDHRLGARAGEVSRLLGCGFAVFAIMGALMPLVVATLDLALRYLPLRGYEKALPPLFILAAGAVFQFGMAMMEPLIFSVGRSARLAAFIAAGMAAINALGDIALIPQIGIAGAAIATTFAYAFGMSCYALLIRRISGRASLRDNALVAMGFVPVGVAFLIPYFPEIWRLPALAGVSVLLIAFGRQLGLFEGLAIVQPYLQRMGAVGALMCRLVVRLAISRQIF